MKEIAIIVISALCVAGCKDNTKKPTASKTVYFTEGSGLECAFVYTSSGGGLSCNWEKYNKEREVCPTAQTAKRR